MSDQKTAYGACTEISEKSGWTSFHIDVGTKYPVRLATKKTEIIDQARAVGGEPAVWTYNEVESEKLNENTGKPYINRYLEGVSVNGDEAVRDAAAASLGVPTGPTGGAVDNPRRPLVGGDKDRAITRMACLKAAAETVRHVPGPPTDDRDVALEVMKIAQRFEQWVYRDLAPPPEQLQ